MVDSTDVTVVIGNGSAQSEVHWHVDHEIGSSARVCGSYSRVVVDALSTHLGLFCRIDTTSNVVVCTAEAGGRAANAPSRFVPTAASLQCSVTYQASPFQVQFLDPSFGPSSESTSITLRHTPRPTQSSQSPFLERFVSLHHTQSLSVSIGARATTDLGIGGSSPSGRTTFLLLSVVPSDWSKNRKYRAWRVTIAGVGALA